MQANNKIQKLRVKNNKNTRCLQNVSMVNDFGINSLFFVIVEKRCLYYRIMSKNDIEVNSRFV